jgi:hypothetical protein
MGKIHNYIIILISLFWITNGYSALRQIIQESNDPSLRQKELLAAQAIEANLPGGFTPISVHWSKVPASVAMKELARLANTSILMAHSNSAGRGVRLNAPEATVTFEAERQPFWLVLRELCLQANLVPFEIGLTGITLEQRQQSSFAQVPYCLSRGLFITISQIIDPWGIRQFYSGRGGLGSPGSSSNSHGAPNSFAISFCIYFDPGVHVLQAKTPNITSATYDNGKVLSLPASRESSSREIFANVWNVRSQFAGASPAATKLGGFTGEISMVIQSKCDIWEIKNPLSAANLSHAIPGGGTICMLSLTKSTQPDNTYEVEMTVGFPRSAASMPEANNKVQLFDAAGEGFPPPLVTWGSRSTSGDMAVQRYTLRFRREIAGDPVRMVVEIPTETCEVTIPFVFTNLQSP